MVPTKNQLQREIAIRRERFLYTEFIKLRDCKDLHKFRLNRVLFEMVMNLDYADFDYE